MKSAHMRGLGFISLLTLCILVLAACVQPASPTGSTAPAAAEATSTPAPAEAAAPAADAAAGDAEAGAYLVSVIGCGCHMNQDLGGMAGGRAFEGDFGVVHSANVTSDPDTGIGNWTAEQIATAIRTGQRPDGSQLYPVMPYMRFSALSDQDALDVGAFLLSLPPISNAVPARALQEEPQAFTPANPSPAESPTDPVARGGYVATLANCGSCHTPRGENGSPNLEMLLAGAKLQDEVVAPNLTPAEGTGVSKMSEQEIADLLHTGKYPDGSEVQDPMASQIKNRFSKLTEEDALAIATFLKSLPPVENDPSQ